MTQQPNRRNLLKGGLLSIASMAGFPSLSAAVQEASTPHNRPKLKITDIRTAEVRVHGYQVQVRVYTDQGIVGQGGSTDAAAGNVPLIRSFARVLADEHAPFAVTDFSAAPVPRGRGPRPRLR